MSVVQAAFGAHVAAAVCVLVALMLLQLLLYSSPRVHSGSIHLRLERYLLRPASAVVTVSGLTLWVMIYTFTSTPAWLVVALLLWVFSAALGVAYFGPQLSRIALETNRDAAENLRVRWRNRHWCSLALVGLVTYLMVARPEL